MDASPVARWVGFYVGVNAGYGGGNVDDVSETGGGTEFFGWYSAGRSSFRTGGALAGGQIGYNYILKGNLLVGGETDFNWADVRDAANSADFGIRASGFNPVSLFSGSAMATTGLDWIGTTRVRLGYDFGRLLTYVTGGVAYGQLHRRGLSVSEGIGIILISQESSTSTSIGWAAGAGVEYAISDSWSFKTEYLYTSIAGIRSQPMYYFVCGPVTFVPPNFTTNTINEFGTHQVRAGLNYRFAGSFPFGDF